MARGLCRARREKCYALTPALRRLTARPSTPPITSSPVAGSGTGTNILFTMLPSSEFAVHPAGRLKPWPSDGKLRVSRALTDAHLPEERRLAGAKHAVSAVSDKPAETLLTEIEDVLKLELLDGLFVSGPAFVGWYVPLVIPASRTETEHRPTERRRRPSAPSATKSERNRGQQNRVSVGRQECTELLPRD